MPLYIDARNRFEVPALTDDEDDSLVADATVTVRVYDSNGEELASASLEAQGNGLYTGSARIAGLIQGRKYFVQFEALVAGQAQADVISRTEELAQYARGTTGP